VATERSPVPPLPLWQGRLAEWGVLMMVVLVLAFALARELRHMRGQAELAQLKSTLGALRTALVIAHLQSALPRQTGGLSGSVANVQRNPFAVLQQFPASYAGEGGPEVLSQLPGGSWVFDPRCVCIGYQPMEPDWLDSPREATALWFRVSAPPGPLQLSAEQHYVWMGQALD
jgi:hypothetical protein